MCPAATGGTTDVFNPATGSVIGTVAHAGLPDLERAVQAVQRGFDVWRKVSAAERAAAMRRAAALLREGAVDIGRVPTLEQGKPLQQAMDEELNSAKIIEWFADEGQRT